MLALLFAFWTWLSLLLGPPITPTVKPQVTPQMSSSPETNRTVQTLDVTAYCATGNNTASGVPPEIGMAAGNRWPFGTVLDVPGYGRVTITDRIGHGSDLDLYMGDGQACLDKANGWGRRHLAVTIIP